MERQFGPYRLVRQVAVGGMAEIHLAKAKGIAGFEKYVALKMIHPNFAEDEQFIDMLVDEAKIAVQLTHQNIAQTFDLGRVGDTYYISMEYVDGADLYKVLRRASEQDIEFPLDVCAFIAKEVATGLDYAHRKRDVTGAQLGIVHRDVSPQNVLVSYAGEVKLVDFGIAKATMKVKQTAAGVIKGKYYYMSPEQASGGRVDSRSDIFSAGIVLYEMLTGQMLYLEEDLHRLLDMVRRADIASPSKLRRGIPPQLERIVMHALAKTPPERYQSGADMASDLERFLHAYSPVFTPAKLVGLLRQAVGDQTLTMENPEVADSLQPLDDRELMRAPGELRDSNSVIFRVKPRPLDDFDHIDTNAATDSGLHGAIAEVIQEVIEDANPGGKVVSSAGGDGQTRRTGSVEASKAVAPGDSATNRDEARPPSRPRC
jgi:eukaryotic-like serine/threonine-protein kinase